MENLSMLLGRLTALSIMTAVSELMLPSGGLKQCTRLLAGLMVAELMLRLILALPASLGA